MVLISLRASWRHRIAEEKIYHDENEVAENMILDEHEEYLRYISRYKHEWQEYNGFGSASMRKSTSFSASEEDGSEDIYTSGSGSGSQVISYTNPMDNLIMNDDMASLASGDISFPSLNVPPSCDESSIQEGPIVPVPPPLLSDRRSDEEIEDGVDQSQEVMLFNRESLGCPAGNQHLGPQKGKAKAKTKEEEEKSEVTPVPRDDKKTDSLSSDSGESTDFSSIGRAASGMNTNLYWRHQLGSGVEVAFSSDVSDSLMVSPTSQPGLYSFDLTKTPSQSFEDTEKPLIDHSKIKNILLPQSSSSSDGEEENSEISWKLKPMTLPVVPIAVTRQQSCPAPVTSLETTRKPDLAALNEISRQQSCPTGGDPVETKSKQKHNSSVDVSSDQIPSNNSGSNPQQNIALKVDVPRNQTTHHKPHASSGESAGSKSRKAGGMSIKFSPYQFSRQKSCPTSQASNQLQETNLSTRKAAFAKPYDLARQQSCPTSKSQSNASHPVIFSDRPLTSTRTKTRLFNLVRKFDPRPSTSDEDDEDERTI